MKKHLSLFVVLFFLFNIFPNYFYIIDQSFASDSKSGEEKGEGVQRCRQFGRSI